VKSGKPRHVVLTREGHDFMAQRAAGKPGSVHLFLRGKGTVGANQSSSGRSAWLARRGGSIHP
jgi:hypothetical protein